MTEILPGKLSESPKLQQGNIWNSWKAAFLQFGIRHWPACLLYLLVLVWNIPLYRGSSPIVFYDSVGYKELGTAMLQGKWTGYYFRTPGYPLFLGLNYFLFGLGADGKGNDHAVMATQFFLGSLIPILLYFALLPLVRYRWIAVVSSCVWLADRYSLGLQSTILTEALCQFLILSMIVAFQTAAPRKRWPEALLLGLLFGYALLVRPAFQYYHFCVAGGAAFLDWFYSADRKNWKPLATWYGAFLLSVQLVIWGWSCHTKWETGYFKLSTQLGASLTNHTGEIMEKAPASYGKVRDLYLEARNKKNGDHINLYDNIKWDLEKATGLKQWDISMQYLAIGKTLILGNLGWYLGRVNESWQGLWGAWQVKGMEIGSGYAGYLTDTYDFGKTIRSNLQYAFIFAWVDNLVWRPNMYRPVKLPWIVLSFTVAFILWKRRDPAALLSLGLISGTVFYYMGIHAFVQYAEFGRYRVPVHPLFLSLLVALPLCIFSEMAVFVYSQMKLTDSTNPENEINPTGRRGSRRANARTNPRNK